MFEEIEKDCAADTFTEVIKDSAWAQQIWGKIEAMSKNNFLEWYTTVTKLAGSNPDCIQTWSDGYIKVLEETLADLNSDMVENYNATIIKIEDLLKKLERECRDLHMKMPSNIGENKLSLFEEKIQLSKKVNEYEVIINSKKKKLLELEDKQKKLCKSLGKPLKFEIQYSPLPTDIEIDEYYKCVTLLEQEEFEVREKYYSLKEKCLKLSNELNYEPESEFESSVLLCSDFVSLTTDNMKKLDTFFQKLHKIHETVLEDIYNLRTKVEDYWKILDIELIVRDEFRNQYSKNNADTLAALKRELKKCEEIRNANMKIFVEKLRVKLQEIWHNCHCPENEKNQFIYFKSDCFTEDLLDLHEIEIQRWEKYYEKNKILLNSLEKYQDLWSKVLELEENAASSNNRYKNRGGTLLQEEKERNKLSKMIPLVESKIKILSDKFSDEYGTQFTSFGKSTDEIITEMYNLRENNRKARLNVRSAATSILTTPNKRKLTPGTPGVDFKRSKIDLTRRLATPKISKLTYTPLTLPSQRRRSRSSMEKQKKQKCKTKRRSKSTDSSIKAYNTFQAELSKRDDCRSTIVPGALGTVEEIRTPRVTPFKPSREKLGTPSTSNNASAKTKLTTCKSNLNLLF